MAETSVFLLILLVSFTEAIQDAEVSCLYLESCVLPCGFDPGPDPIINWFRNTAEGDLLFYSIYIDRLQYQEEEYKHRTSLLGDVHTGNTSLLLTEVKVQDEGRYVCFTSTGRGTQTAFVNLTVYVNVAEVDVEKLDSEVICRSEGLYPEPVVTWHTRTGVQSQLTEAEGRTTVLQREDQLYDVHSSVTLQSGLYVCNVSTAHRWRRAVFIPGNHKISIFGGEVVFPCLAANAPIKSLLWKFNQHFIYNQTGSERVYNESWRPLVCGVTESFHLVLKDLTGGRDDGLYSCHIRTDTDTFVVVTRLTILLSYLPIVFYIFLFYHITTFIIEFRRGKSISRYLIYTELLRDRRQTEELSSGPADTSLQRENDADETDEPQNPEEIPLTQICRETPENEE